MRPTTKHIHPRVFKRFEKAKAEFPSKLENLLGIKFSTECSIYNGGHDPIWIECLTHQVCFLTTPSIMLSGKNKGCILCSSEHKSLIYSEKSRATFKNKVHAIHGGDYDLTMVWYRNNTTVVMVWCKACRKMILITPAVLIRGGGCNDCGQKRATAKQIKKARDSFKQKAEAKHGLTKYNYDDSDYIINSEKIGILCNGCGEVFWQVPSKHIGGDGCPNCSEAGFKPNKPAILYYLGVETRNKIAYKIGITNLTVKERFKNYELEIITVVMTWEFSHGRDAQEKETEIKRKFKEFRYEDEPLLNYGNTELFDRDVLGLDK